MKTTSELLNKSYRILFYDQETEYEETIAILNKKLETDKNSNAFNNLGVAYFEIGEFEKAFENLTMAISLNGENGVAFINRAELNKKWKKLTEAEIDYGKAIEISPQDATYWRCRAYLRKEKGELEKALADFKQAKNIEPKFQPTINEIVALEQSIGIKRKSWIKK